MSAEMTQHVIKVSQSIDENIEVEKMVRQVACPQMSAEGKLVMGKYFTSFRSIHDLFCETLFQPIIVNGRLTKSIRNPVVKLKRLKIQPCKVGGSSSNASNDNCVEFIPSNEETSVTKSK